MSTHACQGMALLLALLRCLVGPGHLGSDALSSRDVHGANGDWHHLMVGKQRSATGGLFSVGGSSSSTAGLFQVICRLECHYAISARNTTSGRGFRDLLLMIEILHHLSYRYRYYTTSIPTLRSMSAIWGHAGVLSSAVVP